MAGPYLSANSYLALIKEATSGTLPTTGPATWLPVTTPQITPQQVFLRDEALRGSPVMDYDQVQGVRHDEVDFKTYLYADTFPLLVQAILGGSDTVTSSSMLYTHTIHLLNNTTGSQPTTLSIVDFDGANWFSTTGAQADSLQISFGAEVAAEATVKFMANPYTGYTSAPNSVFTTPSFTAEHLIPAWDTTVTLAAATNATVTSGEITLNRKTQAIYTLGTQAPYNLFAGPLEVTGKLTLVLSSTSDPFSYGSTAYALTRSPQSLIIFLSDPNDTSSGTNHSLQFTMSAAQFHSVKRTRGKEYVEVEVEFTANANTSDASSGYAPIGFVAQNGRSTAY